MSSKTIRRGVRRPCEVARHPEVLLRVAVARIRRLRRRQTDHRYDRAVALAKQQKKAPKPLGKLAIVGDLTNLFITDDGTIVYTTTQECAIWRAGQSSKAPRINLDDTGTRAGLAFFNHVGEFVVFRPDIKTGAPTFTFYRQLQTNPTKETLKNSQIIEEIVGVGSHGPYVYLITNYRRRITLIDPVYNVIALNLTQLSAEIRHVHMIWGALVVVLENGELRMRSELTTREKIERFCGHGKFDCALRMAEEFNVPDDVKAKVHRSQGDTFYTQGKFDEAIREYICTLGIVEPSYVIQKVVEPHHARQLMLYLTELQRKDKATKQHTTLLFNCYTKLGDKQRLEQAVSGFVEAARRGEAPTFDVQTAVDVLKRNGYPEHAEKLASGFHQHGTSSNSSTRTESTSRSLRTSWTAAFRGSSSWSISVNTGPRSWTVRTAESR
jgi:hypothetical protein